MPLRGRGVKVTEAETAASGSVILNKNIIQWRFAAERNLQIPLDFMIAGPLLRCLPEQTCGGGEGCLPGFPLCFATFSGPRLTAGTRTRTAEPVCRTGAYICDDHTVSAVISDDDSISADHVSDDHEPDCLGTRPAELVLRRWPYICQGPSTEGSSE